jgi:hypothetical protein
VASKLLRATPESKEDAVHSKSGPESPLFLIALLGSIAAYAVLVAMLVGVCKPITADAHRPAMPSRLASK